MKGLRSPKDEIEGELVKAITRGFNRSIILWLLSQGSRSGYTIVKEMRNLTGLSFQPGSIYPLLYDMEVRGFIAGQWVERGKRRMKYYSITEEGRRLLDRLKKLFRMPIGELLEDLIAE